jgi:hypothetical protein
VPRLIRARRISRRASAGKLKDVDLLRDHSIAFSFGRRCGLVIQPLDGNRSEYGYRADSRGVL